MKTRSGTILGAAALAAAFQAAAAQRCGAADRPAAAPRPNIILILTDDQGYGDLSCHGNPILKTPNLDRLHDEGRRFTDFHVSPTCAPTRCSLMTGRHEFKSGVTHTIAERERMSLKATTLAELLKSAGYTTGIFGKWHLGDEPDHWPDKRGFDEFFIHGAGGIGQTYAGSCGDAPGNRYFSPAILHNGKFEKTQGYCTDVFFAQALRWIEAQKGTRPFFAYITPNAPHAPLDCPEEYEKRYADKVEPNVAKFFGMIANIDDNVGRLLARLHEWGIERQTLVIFMNDNGGTAGLRVYNAGMRTGKGTPYNGGTRAASFWRWPGTLAPGDVDKLAAHVDVLPTLAELAGAKIPENVAAKLDGRSLAPLLKDPAAAWPDRYLLTHVGRWERGAAAESKYRNASVRSPRYNLVSARRTGEKHWELYDLKADPGEKNDVAAQHPDVVAKMAAAYDEWWASILPCLENEDAVGPKVNPFKELYWKQFGGGPGPEQPRPEKLEKKDRRGPKKRGGGKLVSAAAVEVAPAAPAPPPSPAQVEADWLRQDEVRSVGKVTPEEDAAGACDGIKNGKWGFHTALEDNPWWQVDLGASRPLDRVLIYNRCDHTAGRAARLAVLLSADGKGFRKAYQHDGAVFQGQPDGKPLAVPLGGAAARYVRIQVPGLNCLHFDEVEVFAAGEQRNAALGRPATQSSVCEWSRRKITPGAARQYPVALTIERGMRLARSLGSLGAKIDAERKVLEEADKRWRQLPADAPDAARRGLYFEARWAVRRMALANPLLDFKDLLVATSAPGRWSHMSDQYLGWWSQPGGGLYVLEDFKSPRPRLRPLTPGLAPGNVLRPDLSYDGRKVLFAYCRYYPGLSEWPDKLDKSKLPEDSFYHLFEVGIDGSGLRQLTRGKYNDFDGRYLPDGQIVFCSTRRGQAVQCSKETAMASLGHGSLPESYVRCGGGPERPCAVYTLHAMDPDGGNLRPVSSFEMFEWTPSIDAQGRILYSRWDYVDRYGQNAMGLWATMPDGTNAQAVFGNYTRNPECMFEARSIPGSRRLVFTASGHHSITAGSLVLLDPALGHDVPAALVRLTPEVPFPESEGHPATYYANPYPLSEEFYLTAWSDRPLKFQGQQNDLAALGVYLYDAFGNLELLYRDPAIGSQYPLPIRPRPRPQRIVPQVNWDAAKEARMLLLSVYEGLNTVPRGSIKRLRVVGMPVKTHPTMDYPSIGLTTHDSGRFVLGSVPVEPDGSAFFRVPSGVTFFMQALDDQGMAVQTMRSGVYLQPGQTYTCIGCHEQRGTAPPNAAALAARREPSKLAPGPDGSWPLDYAALVQPVLDRQCVACHKPGTQGEKFDLTAAKSYSALVNYGSPSLEDVVVARYKEQRSTEGACEARTSEVLKLLERGHYDVRLSADDRARLVTWMDTLGQRVGHFSRQQEDELRRLREKLAAMLDR